MVAATAVVVTGFGDVDRDGHWAAAAVAFASGFGSVDLDVLGFCASSLGLCLCFGVELLGPRCGASQVLFSAASSEVSGFAL